MACRNGLRGSWEGMTQRQSDHPIDPLFLERWSPRAFDGSEIPDSDLMTMFEAARWAPSAFNSQPWLFLYAKREEADWQRFLGLLIPWNQGWAHSASVLIYILSDSLMETRPGIWKESHSHSFDAGAAWASLALQATRLGYRAHGMSGVGKFGHQGSSDEARCARYKYARHDLPRAKQRRQTRP